MDPQIIKLDKTTIDNETGTRSIDRTFSELIPKEDLVSVDQFFSYYNKLFYDIPRDGTISHKTLIDQSTEFYGNYQDPKDEIIRDLEKQILELNNQLLKGDLKTIGVGAEGVKAGFTRTFAEFEVLRKAGMNQEQARKMYSGAQSVIDIGARAGGRDIDISVVEQAALGSREAQETLTLAAAETQGQSSMIGGARKKDGKVTGLLEQ